MAGQVGTAAEACMGVPGQGTIMAHLAVIPIPAAAEDRMDLATAALARAQTFSTVVRREELRSALAYRRDMDTRGARTEADCM
jgi:hypothetical protein